MRNTKTYKPSAFLGKYIDRFYTFQQSSASYFKPPPVLPGTGLELVFYLGEPLSINHKKLPKSHTVCPRKLIYFDEVKDVSFLSVRFKSGAFRHFTSVPLSELNNTYYTLEQLWGLQGKELLQTLNTPSEIEAKIEQIDSFLTTAFKTYHNKKDDLWDSIIDDLYYNFDENTITQLAQKTHLSLRQFERGFKAQFGITAKEFQKITRFQNVVKCLLLNKDSNYLETILDSGYFDQSHFIREFKTLTQQTPLEYFTDVNFNAHFYHRSIHTKHNSYTTINS